MAIEARTVEHIARLAHIGLDEDEVEDLSRELASVLEHVERLKRVDTWHVPATAFVVPLENVLRADDVTPSWPPDAALANAPRRSGDYFEVQAIFEA